MLAWSRGIGVGERAHRLLGRGLREGRCRGADNFRQQDADPYHPGDCFARSSTHDAVFHGYQAARLPLKVRGDLAAVLTGEPDSDEGLFLGLPFVKKCRLTSETPVFFMR